MSAPSRFRPPGVLSDPRPAAPPTARRVPAHPGAAVSGRLGACRATDHTGAAPPPRRHSRRGPTPAARGPAPCSPLCGCARLPRGEGFHPSPLLRRGPPPRLWPRCHVIYLPPFPAAPMPESPVPANRTATHSGWRRLSRWITSALRPCACSSSKSRDEARKLQLQVALPEPDLGPFGRGHGRAVVRIDVDLRDARGSVQVALGPGADQRQRARQERRDLGPPVGPGVAVDPGHHRQVEPVPGLRPLEHLAARVHQVQAAQVDQRHRSALDHIDVERGRQAASDLGAGHPGVAQQRGLGHLRIDEQEVVAAPHRQDPQELLGVDARQAVEPDLLHAEGVAGDGALVSERAQGAEQRQGQRRRQAEPEDPRQLSPPLSRDPVHPPPIRRPCHAVSTGRPAPDTSPTPRPRTLPGAITRRQHARGAVGASFRPGERGEPTWTWKRSRTRS